MSLFYLLLKTNRGKVSLAVLVSIVSGLTNAALIPMINAGWRDTEAHTAGLIWTFVGALVLLVASGFLAQIMVLDIALRAIAELRHTMSTKILATPLWRLEELGPPRILAALTDDVSTVSRIMPNIPRFVIDMTMMLGCIAYMAYLSPQALVIIVGFLGLGYVVYHVFARRSLHLMAAGREVYDDIFDHFRALNEGLKQLKLNRKRKQVFLDEDLYGSLESYRSLNMSGRTLLIASENITRILFFVVLGLLVFGVTRFETMDDHVISGYVMATLFMYRPLGSLMALVPDISRAAVALRKVDAMGLDLDSGPREEQADVPSGQPWTSVELRDVTYSYRRRDDDSTFELGPVNLRLEPGELVFIVGGNGSGKTTLAKVLTSLYPPETGEVLLDGKPLGPQNRERYRQLFSVVFADFHLFHRLVAENDETDLDALAAKHLEELQLSHKVTVEDGRISTTELSQGQRKRLALLTAYCEDRAVYVFDEWAADQDPQFKRIFYTRVLPELKARGKTILAITHDDRYFYVADRCLKLEDGQVLPQPLLEPSGEPNA